VAKGYAVDYRNVKTSKSDLEEMLKHTLGQRQVPVIVEDGRVTIGYGGS
jgi:glutaredoxin 3